MELVETLENILSNDKNLRLKSEEIISNLIEKGLQEYLEKMTFILIDERFSLKARQMAATLLKNPILHIPKIQEQWLTFDITVKDNIRNQILTALGSENEFIRIVTGSVIAAFAKVETPISEKWKTLFPCLCQTNFGNDKFLLSAVQTLGFIAEEVSKKDLLSEEIDQILYLLVVSIENNLNNINVIAAALKAIVKVLPLIGARKMEIKNYAEILFNKILIVGEAYSTNEKILEIICRIFIELAENYYYTIDFFIKEISSFSFVLIGGNVKSLALLGLEFWCRLASEEANKVKNDLEKKLKSSKGYLQLYFDQLYEIIDKFLVIMDDDDDEWNVSKASCYLLVLLVKTVNENSLLKITKDVEGKNFLIIRTNKI